MYTKLNDSPRSTLHYCIVRRWSRTLEDAVLFLAGLVGLGYFYLTIFQQDSPINKSTLQTWPAVNVSRKSVVANRFHEKTLTPLFKTVGPDPTIDSLTYFHPSGQRYRDLIAHLNYRTTQRIEMKGKTVTYNNSYGVFSTQGNVYLYKHNYTDKCQVTSKACFLLQINVLI